MPELVAPIMPDIAGSFRPLARGIAQWAENRRYAQQLELSQQKLAQDAASDQQRFELSRQQLANQFQVQQSQMDLNRAHADYYKNYAAPLRGLAAQQTIEFNKQMAELSFDAAGRRKELGLDDPILQTKNPIMFAANARRFADEYGTAPTSTGIEALIQADKRVTDQMKIPLKLGVQFDEAGDPIQGTGTATPVKYPVVQIVEQLQDPAWNKYMTDSLKASGYMKQVPGAEHKEGGVNLPYFGNVGGKTVREKGTTEMGDIIGRYLKLGESVDFSRGGSRVKPITAPTSGAFKGTGQYRQGLQQQLEQTDAGAELPEPDQSNLYPSSAPAASGPPGPEPTETDQILNQARAALQAGAPLQMVAQRLAAQQIDPRMLFQEQALQGTTQSPQAPGVRFNRTGIA